MPSRSGWGYGSYHHLISVHNILIMYPKRDWMSHVSVQSGDVQQVALWRRTTAFRLSTMSLAMREISVRLGKSQRLRFCRPLLTVVARGSFRPHGETFHREDEVLWWSKGGKPMVRVSPGW